MLVEAISPGCESWGRVKHTNCVYCQKPLDADGIVIQEVELPPVLHRYDIWTDPVSPTCDKQGSIGYFTCSACGKIFDECKNEIFNVEIAMLDHSGGEASCSKTAICDCCGKGYGMKDPDNHKYLSGVTYNNDAHALVCECGTESEYIAHTFLETVVKEPTAFSLGEKDLACSCGYKYYEKIPMLTVDSGASDVEISEPPNIFAVIALAAFGVAILSATMLLLVKISLGKKRD